MTIYWATSYFLKPEKAGDYQKWLNSKEAKSITKSIEKETGFKYLNTYFPILGLGEYDVEDWMAAPDWASADKIRGSKGWSKWAEKTWDMIDQSRSFKSGDEDRHRREGLRPQEVVRVLFLPLRILPFNSR